MRNFKLRSAAWLSAALLPSVASSQQIRGKLDSRSQATIRVSVSVMPTFTVNEDAEGVAGQMTALLNYKIASNVSSSLRYSVTEAELTEPGEAPGAGIPRSFDHLGDDASRVTRLIMIVPE